MEFVYDDGGRAAAGFKGQAGDCVCRAFAIASGKPYKEVYDLINQIARENPYHGKKRSGDGKSSARNGVYKEDIRRLGEALGFEYVPLMGIGTGCTVHVRPDELPQTGRYVLSVSHHESAWIDGVSHDTYDISRDGTRCVYGYYRIKGATA